MTTGQMRVAIGVVDSRREVEPSRSHAELSVSESGRHLLLQLNQRYDPHFVLGAFGFARRGRHDPERHDFLEDVVGDHSLLAARGANGLPLFREALPGLDVELVLVAQATH